MIRRLRREGQSTVEFALMMPVMLLVFFWMFEANIMMTGMHMTAYASFAAARSYLVAHNSRGTPIDNTCTVDLSGAGGSLAPGFVQQDANCWVNGEDAKHILTGRIFVNSVDGPFATQITQSNEAKGWGPNGAMVKDGVRIHIHQFAALPYARTILQFHTYVPTHLGPNEWDRQAWPDLVRDQDGDPNTLTDNNQNDSSPPNFVPKTKGPVGGGGGGGGGGGPGGRGNGRGGGNNGNNGNGNRNGNMNGNRNFGNGNGNRNGRGFP